MPRALTALFPFLPALTALHAQTSSPTHATGTLLGRTACPLPAFERLSESQARELTRYADREEFEATRADRGFILEKLRYASDGLAVVAYLAAVSGQ